MLDFNSLPLVSKLILITGFSIGITSFILFLRYPVMLILMKYKPKYRESIKKTIARKKLKNNLMMRKIIFVTGNAHKVGEAKDILSPLGIIVEQNNCGYPELQEDKLEAIAKFGARWAAEKLNQEVMVDDSGLFIEALGGFPGPYSAYVFDTLGNERILKVMEGEKNRSAVFKCVIGYCRPGEEAIVFSGEVAGEMAKDIRGSVGFGYDPIFEVGGVTFGEMKEEEKNRLSHRYRALLKFAEWLK
jgi:XTP/dITP diphosphohydrolase